MLALDPITPACYAGGSVVVSGTRVRLRTIVASLVGTEAPSVTFISAVEP